ncbi:MAG: hypothetical protein KGD58_11625 [Candidatus Lokiarchaeota archaeon]|nr:hypothetical protein [Candidatus Lokiarchaeota archaeon]
MSSKKKFRDILLVLTIFFISAPLFTGLMVDSTSNSKTFELSYLENLQPSEVIDHPNNSWIDNPTFEGAGIPWFSSTDGDDTDVNAAIYSNQANYDIIGDTKTFSEVSGIPQAADWSEFNHSIRPLPLTHEINQYGLNVSHVYDEDDTGDFPNSGDQTANLAGVMWKRNISLSEDMSDYQITSASISAIVNGSGDTDLETPNDHPPFADGGYASLFDFTRFYIQISDLNNLEPYEIAYFKTVDLGEGYAGRRVYSYATRNFLNDTNMIAADDDVLKFALSQVLRHDNHNFTITLGIDVDCEDNYPGYELDVWYSLLIKSCNLTFTYEKIVDQGTLVSWNQIGNSMNGTSVRVTEANLRFEYKIDQLWPTSLSPNSEIRILINNRQHAETIRLSSATTTFQDAKEDGFELSGITLPYENVTLSIQVYLADEFLLINNITVSITNVYLIISYTETFSEFITEPWIFTALLVIASLVTVIVGGYLYAYQKILKYPRPVRKVIKFRKSLRRSNIPNVVIVSRENSFRNHYRHEVSDSIKTYEGKSGSAPLQQKAKPKAVEPVIESEELIKKSIEKKEELEKIIADSLDKSN